MSHPVASTPSGRVTAAGRVASEGAPAVVVVCGEAGIGKSRLVATGRPIARATATGRR